MRRPDKRAGHPSLIGCDEARMFPEPVMETANGWGLSGCVGTGQWRGGCKRRVDGGWRMVWWVRVSSVGEINADTMK